MRVASRTCPLSNLPTLNWQYIGAERVRIGRLDTASGDTEVGWLTTWVSGDFTYDYVDPTLWYVNIKDLDLQADNWLMNGDDLAAWQV